MNVNDKSVDEIILNPWQEINGSISKVKIEDDLIIFQISCEKIFEIRVPREALKDESFLSLVKNTNRKVSILRTNSEFLIRVYDTATHPSEQ